jgi:hypothetical protein
MWILTCSFSQYIFFIYQLRIGTKSAFEFHNYRSVQISVIWSNFHIKTKPSEIILWARTLAISINIYWICFYVLQIFNLHSIFQFLFSQLKKEQKSLFFSHYLDSNDRLYLYNYFKMFDLLLPFILDWNHS